MKKLGANIDYLIAKLSGDSTNVRINLRATQVRQRYKKAIEAVYRQKAPLFLEHTNNVYIMRQDDVPTLIVYVDDAIFSAELNAQRELIKLKLLELFGEEVQEFKIYVSRGHYKNNHPYSDELGAEQAKRPVAEPLDELEKEKVDEVSQIVEMEHVRTSFQKAMTADMEWKKAKKGKQT